MTIASIELWHKRARPTPTEADFSIQLGCHFEEFVEMLHALDFECDGIGFEVSALALAMNELGFALKSGEVRARPTDRKEFLDSLADQIVTAVGVGHCAHMKTTQAVESVNTSNWSKFDDNGLPIFNDTGKIAKGPDYAPPDLEGMY
jgi:hypothetical protein